MTRIVRTLRRARPLALALGATGFLSQAFAQTEPGALNQSLGAVVITATSKEQPIQDVQASVQVITQKDLQGYAGTSITEALKLAAGVDARPNGANAFVAIRGFISNAGSPVLILVDGLRRTGKYGSVGLNLMGVEEVERVEIVRGPMSALYGADATGGVINIITKAPQPGEALGGNVRATFGGMEDGQRSTRILGATLRAGTENTGHRISAEKRRKGLFRYETTPQTSADLADVDEQFLSYEGVFKLTPDHQLRWLVEHVDQDDTSPAFRVPSTRYTSYERERRTTAALRYLGTIGPGALSVDLSRGQSDASTTRSFPTIETTDYTQTQLDARYTLDLDHHTLVVGAGARREELDVSIVPQAAKATNQHVLVQNEWRFAKDWKFLGGVRYDTFSTFGNVATPRASLSYSPGPLSFRVGYGEAYRAPSVLEQYARFTRGTTLIVGVPDIQPEQNKTWELAAAYRTNDVNAEWVLFSSKVTDLIQTVNSPKRRGDPGFPIGSRATYTNVGRADISGSELSASLRLHERWTLTGGWDYLDARNAETDARLTQRARNTYRLGAQYTQGPWRVDVRARYVKGYFASASGTPVRPVNSNFGTADLKVAYEVNKAWSVAAGVDNVFDRQQPANWTSTGSVQDPPGRFFYMTAGYRF